MRIHKEGTGIHLDGFEVERITVENSRGLEICFLSVGCVIEAIMVADKEGNRENIVLHYDQVKTYLENPDYFGSIVGRTAGRISEGRFVLDGVAYDLERNDQNYNLHGESSGLHIRNWKPELIEQENAAGVTFSLSSPDGAGGYPGNVDLQVSYLLDEENTLHMTYEGKTDKKTVLNMTNHSYFNLSGNLNKQVFDHRLWIDAQQFVPIQENGCPVGLLAGVDGTAFDFRTEKSVGQDIGANETQILRGSGFDHPFLLEKKGPFQIKMTHPASGRFMKVWTDQDAVVLYTANHLDHKAVCLETQNLPDHVNKRGFPFEPVTAEAPYKAQTRITFGTL